MKTIITILLGAALTLPLLTTAEANDCAASARQFANSLPGKNKQIIQAQPRGDRCVVVVRVSSGDGQPPRVVREEIPR